MFALYGRYINGGIQCIKDIARSDVISHVKMKVSLESHDEYTCHQWVKGLIHNPAFKHPIIETGPTLL